MGNRCLAGHDRRTPSGMMGMVRSTRASETRDVTKPDFGLCSAPIERERENHKRRQFFGLISAVQYICSMIATRGRRKSQTCSSHITRPNTRLGRNITSKLLSQGPGEFGYTPFWFYCSFSFSAPTTVFLVTLPLLKHSPLIRKMG